MNTPVLDSIMPQLPGTTPVLDSIMPQLPGTTPVLDSIMPQLPGTTPVLDSIMSQLPGTTPVLDGIMPPVPADNAPSPGIWDRIAAGWERLKAIAAERAQNQPPVPSVVHPPGGMPPIPDDLREQRPGPSLPSENIVPSMPYISEFTQTPREPVVPPAPPPPRRTPTPRRRPITDVATQQEYLNALQQRQINPLLQNRGTVDPNNPLGAIYGGRDTDDSIRIMLNEQQNLWNQSPPADFHPKETIDLLVLNGIVPAGSRDAILERVREVGGSAYRNMNIGNPIHSHAAQAAFEQINPDRRRAAEQATAAAVREIGRTPEGGETANPTRIRESANPSGARTGVTVTPQYEAPPENETHEERRARQRRMLDSIGRNNS